MATPAWPMAACPWSPLRSRVDVVHGDGPGLVVAVVAVDGGAVVGAEVAEVRRVWLSLPHAGRTTAIASATASFHTLNCLPRSTRDTPLPYHRMSDDEVRAFITSMPPHTGKVATVREDGRPHVAPVWYAVDGDGSI